MLRHYDALGLVVPERVDQSTGYRWYAASQVGRVNSLMALRELGFTLDGCRAILDEQIAIEELQGMLRLREGELEQRMAADSGRLTEVGRRLRSIERGLTMTNATLEIKALPALRLAQVSAEVNDTTEISAMTAVLFDTLTQRLADAGLAINGRGIRTYYRRPDGSKVEASVVHRGPAAEIADAWHTLDVGLEEQGLESYGVHRQVFLESAEDSDTWVVELQCPVRESGTTCG